MLTLHFTMPFKTPVKAKAIEVEIYDPEFFIDFGFAAEQSGAACRRAGRLCTCRSRNRRMTISRLELRLDKNLATSEANMGMGADFSNKITVTCR